MPIRESAAGVKLSETWYQSRISETPLAVSVSKDGARFHDLVVSAPDQPHIRSPREAAARTSRLRRSRLRRMRLFLITAFQAMDWFGSSPGALAGDATALKVCLDRILPPRKDRPVNFKLPSIKNAQGV